LRGPRRAKPRTGGVERCGSARMGGRWGLPLKRRGRLGLYVFRMCVGSECPPFVSPAPNGRSKR